MVAFLLGLLVGTNVGMAVTAFLLFVSRRGAVPEGCVREGLVTVGGLAVDLVDCPEGPR